MTPPVGQNVFNCVNSISDFILQIFPVTSTLIMLLSGESTTLPGKIKAMAHRHIPNLNYKFHLGGIAIRTVSRTKVSCGHGQDWHSNRVTMTNH